MYLAMTATHGWKMIKRHQFLKQPPKQSPTTHSQVAQEAPQHVPEEDWPVPQGRQMDPGSVLVRLSMRLSPLSLYTCHRRPSHQGLKCTGWLRNQISIISYNIIIWKWHEMTRICVICETSMACPRLAHLACLAWSSKWMPSAWTFCLTQHWWSTS